MTKKEALQMTVELKDKKKDEFLFEATEEGRKVIVKKCWVKFKEEENKWLPTKEEPSIVDSAFDIGRIMHCIFEHSYVSAPGRMTARERQDKQKKLTAAHKKHMAAQRKTAFKFPMHVAPYKCSIFYMRQNEDCHEIAEEISVGLTAAGISYRTAFIGTRISDAQEQMDYLGVPILIRVESSVMIKLQQRYEDQIIVVPRAQILSLVLDLTQGRKRWSEIVSDDSEMF